MPIDWDAYQANLAAQHRRPGRHRLPYGQASRITCTPIEANRHNVLAGATNRLIATPDARAGLTTIRINRNQKEE